MAIIYMMRVKKRFTLPVTFPHARSFGPIGEWELISFFASEFSP